MGFGMWRGLKATSSGSIEIANTSVTNIHSNFDIISLSDCQRALLSNVTIQNILKIHQENPDQIFVLNALNIKSLNIDKSDFTKIGFSSVKAKNTHLKMQNSTFSNRLETDHRILAQSNNEAKLNQSIQFILLDSSNSALTKISFIENALNSLVDGGAVQILGSGGDHSLTDCIFENNQGVYGGAVFVKGQANSISILNSQFDNNQASGNGGALFFADRSVKNEIVISQTTFLQNSATLGGAIYLGNQALIAESSSFIENNARLGGAIATMSTHNTLVDLRQNSFIRNNATEGAALIALQEMNLDYSTSSFKENTAVHGGYIASTPTSLRLKVYSFESYFLFINGTGVKDILSRDTTIVIYDSASANASELVPFISGAHPNLLFEVTILDAFGKKMVQTNKAQGAFQISSSSSSSSLVGMLGTTAFTYSNSTAYIFKSFSVKGPFGTTVTLSIEGTYFSQTSNSLQHLPSLKFPIILDKCSVGQLYDQSSAICSYCASSTYSLADPFTADTCERCFDNAICLGGSVTFPAQGYWRLDESSENLIKCPQADSCLGGSKDGGKNISLTGFCEEGYEGVACSTCSSGYAKFGTSQSCKNCKESKLYYVMFGGYLCIQAVAIIFSIKVNIQDSSKEKSVVQSALIKIIIDFLQILTLISEFNFNFPPLVNSLYDGISKILPTNIDALSVDCFIALRSNRHIFFNKVLVILAEPFAYLFFAYIGWIIIFRVKRKVFFRNLDFKKNIYLTIIVIIYVLQPGIIKILFELFNCKNYGSQDDPKYYLVYDVNVECWKREHLIWALSIAIPTFLIGLLAPFVILAYWTRDKGLRAAQRVQKVYTFIFKPYQNKALFWEIAIFLRKIILIIISIFITSQYLQAYLGFVLLALYYCSLYKISPYNIPQLNFAEAISLGSSAFILYSGLYFVRSEQKMDTVSYILFACDIISGIAFVAYVIYAFLKKYTPAIQRKVSRLGSKILTNLKAKTHAKHIRAPSIQSPVSLNGPNDTPMSTERFMSLEGITSTERFMSTERFATAERFLTTERFMTSEGFMSTERLPPTERFMSTDRPLSPVIKIRESEEEVSESRRENEIEVGDELMVFSPANQTQARMFNFGSQPSLPVNLQELELSPEDPDFQEFAETLKNESRNRPRRSGRNKLDKVFTLTKEDWTIELSRKDPKSPHN